MKRISPYHAVLIISLILGFIFKQNLWHILLLNVISYVLLTLKEWKNVILTAKRDLTGIYIVLSLERDLRRETRKRSTIASIFRERVTQHPHKTAFIDVDTDRKFTFLEFENLSNQIANYLKKENFEKNDVVALYMNNCVEYVAFWLAVSKLGGIATLINYNLRLQPLGHCISAASAKYIIADSDHLPAVKDAVDNGHIDKNIRLYHFGKNFDDKDVKAKNILLDLPKFSTEFLIPTDAANFTNILLYFYTSGTTGLPKPAIITQARFYMTARGVYRSFNIKPNDVIYLTMPLYHGGAGMVGIGQTLLNGCTCVVRKRFSASRFWDDCVKYNCTTFHYIGEICRYLLAQPFNKNENSHSIRLMIGNGLRSQIWQEFVDRFHVGQVGEFYGSTEGNTSLVNINNQVGACGFFPIAVVYPLVSYLNAIYPITLIKVDESTGEIVRDKDGLVVRCGPGEHGEIVGKIIKGSPFKEFNGYLSRSDTNKKLVRDVFRKGDVAFSSGDVLFMDEKGYLYFKDRIGDTFRWKGENVSTTEVEGVIQNIIGFNDATVYGVEVYGMEGKAGMAALKVSTKNFDLKSFNSKLKEILPHYARPVFLRICDRIEFTGTYKFKKEILQKSGFNPNQIKEDKLFYMNLHSGEYEELSTDVYNKILSHALKL